MRKIIINNSTEWPAWALRVICPWVLDKSGVTWSYTFNLKNARRKTTGYSGHGRKDSCILSLSKDYERLACVDHRYKNKFIVFARTRLDILVFLLAHEVAHANAAHPDKWLRATARDSRSVRVWRVDRKKMELKANEEGRRLLDLFRAEWPEILKQLKRSKASDGPPERIARHAFESIKGSKVSSGVKANGNLFGRFGARTKHSSL